MLAPGVSVGQVRSAVNLSKYLARPADMRDGRLESSAPSAATAVQRLSAADQGWPAPMAALLTELAWVQQRRRRQLGQHLQEQLLQQLVGVLLMLERLRAGVDEGLAAEVERLHQLLSGALQSARYLSDDLYPPIFEEADLNLSLHWLARSVHERRGLAVEVSIADAIVVSSPLLRMLLFDAVREALHLLSQDDAVAKLFLVAARIDSSKLLLVVSTKELSLDRGLPLADDSLAERCRPQVLGGLDLRAIRDSLTLLGGDIRGRCCAAGDAYVCIKLPLSLAADAGDAQTPLVDRRA